MSERGPEPGEREHVGRWAVCSRGRIGRIEGRKELEWGLSWVGTGADGKPWASRNPEVISTEAASRLLLREQFRTSQEPGERERLANELEQEARSADLNAFDDNTTAYDSLIAVARRAVALLREPRTNPEPERGLMLDLMASEVVDWIVDARNGKAPRFEEIVAGLSKHLSRTSEPTMEDGR